MGFDNTNYWIKVTTDLGLERTYTITTFVTNGVVTISIESFSIEIVNPCIWKSNGSPQTVLAQTATTFPSSWEVTVVSGTAQSFNFDDSYFKMEELSYSINQNYFPNGIEVTIDIEDCISKNFSLSLQVQYNLNETLKLKLEKYLRYELNKELRRIYSEDKFKNVPKKVLKDNYNYLPSVYQSNNQALWSEFYKLNDSLQLLFKTMKPILK